MVTRKDRRVKLTSRAEHKPIHIKNAIRNKQGDLDLILFPNSDADDDFFLRMDDNTTRNYCDLHMMPPPPVGIKTEPCKVRCKEGVKINSNHHNLKLGTIPQPRPSHKRKRRNVQSEDSPKIRNFNVRPPQNIGKQRVTKH